MLGQRVRMVLVWVTVCVTGVVVVSGLANMLRLVAGAGDETPALRVVPPEVTLCTGQEVVFSVEPPLEDVEWAATGGQGIMPDGRYVAGDIAGTYEIQAAGPQRGQVGQAVVNVVVCTPVPTATPEPTPVPSPAPTAVPTPLPAVDPQGDVGIYTTGAPAALPPAGIDLSNASVGADRRVPLLPGESVPTALAGWVQEGETLLWFALYEPVPASLPARTDWLFALDLDGNVSTGRPAGAARVNPDLGMEVAVGVYFEPTGGNFETYLLIWDPAANDWAAGPDVVRFTLSAERTLVALAMPFETLREQVAQTTGVAIAPEVAMGRAAAVTYTSPEAVIDFYPDLPE